MNYMFILMVWIQFNFFFEELQFKFLLLKKITYQTLLHPLWINVESGAKEPPSLSHAKY